MRIVDTDKGYAKLKREIDATKNARVTVGVHGTEGSSQVIIASTHEFGAPVVGIPTRSFLRSTLDKNRNKYKQLAQKMLAKILEAKLTTDKALNLLGLRIKSDVVAKIDSNIPPPNTEGTIKAKGSSHTLIDTGSLKQSITYVVHND